MKRLFLIAVALLNLQLAAIEPHWDWSLLPATSSPLFEKLLSFPKDFVWGTASSAYQIEGNVSANGKLVENTWTRDASKPQAGIGTDHWHRYKEDIDHIYESGMRVYRFHIDWSKIEPEQGHIDYDALDHYVDLVKYMINKGITPIVCLFHHTWPVWFADKGGFEKAVNGDYFVRYARLIFDTLIQHDVHWWMTYNEPTGVVLEGYLRGKLPPGKVGCLRQAGQVLLNMYKTHVAIAQEFKKIDPKAQLGIAHVMQPLHPYHDYNPLEYAICRYFGYLNNQLTLDFMKTGTFNWGGLVTDQVNEAPAAFDYVGLNYYTHTLIKQSSCPPFLPDTVAWRPFEVKAEKKALYAEGLYECIQKAAQVGKPIYITENGTSDNEGIVRDEYIKKHLFVVSKALGEGYDIRGYFYWSLWDSFNWNGGFTKSYGLYAVDYAGKTLNRTLRDNAKPFVNIMRTHVGMQPIA